MGARADSEYVPNTDSEYVPNTVSNGSAVTYGAAPKGLRLRLAAGIIKAVFTRPRQETTQVLIGGDGKLVLRAVDDEPLPMGVTPLEPQVAVGECQECGRDSGDGYTLYLPAASYLPDLRAMGWDVQSGRLLCFDCDIGRCSECGEIKPNSECKSCTQALAPPPAPPAEKVPSMTPEMVAAGALALSRRYHRLGILSRGLVYDQPSHELIAQTVLAAALDGQLPAETPPKSPPLFFNHLREVRRAWTDIRERRRRQ